jgi:electron transfer flavoprotein beta subunit
LKIIVCIKQVPDTTNVKINPETNTLIREGVESIINPFDMYALEEGIRLKERHGGTVTALTMGPPQAESALREAVGLGVDNGVLLSDRAFAGSDTLATAYTLASGINRLEGADIILMGKQAMDGDTGQVGPGVAENLSIPHITDIRKIESVEEDGTIIVERLLEEGYVRLKTHMPVVLTVVKEINEPRLPSLKGKLAARKAEIPTVQHGEMDVDSDRLGFNGSPTQVIKIFTPPKPAGGKILQGEVPETVSALIAELRSAGLAIGEAKKEGE